MSQLMSDKSLSNTPDLDILDPDDKDILDLTTPLKDKDKSKDKSKDKTEKEDEDKDDKDEDEEVVDKDKIKKDEDDDDKDEDEEDDIDDELKALEEELEEPDIEKLELTSPVPRREILKKYPSLFKEFPYLEKAYYREQQFTNVFPTIDEAKTAAENSQTLERYSEDMIENGNTYNVLKMIKDNNPDTFANVVDNYLEHLAKVDESAYHHVLGNVIKHTILGMVKEAKDADDDDLKTAALILNKYAFGSSKFTPPVKLSREKPEDSKSDEISEREKEFTKRQVETVISDVSSSINSVIGATIEKHIDPKGSMTAYVKTSASRDAMEKITSLINKDIRFKKIVDGLYEKAAAANFSKESQDKIKKAYFSKAKSLLAPVLKSARNEALRGMGKRVKDEVIDDDVETNNKDKREKSHQQTERRLSSDKSRAKLDELKSMSSLEALNALMGD